jgi:hypothetical protein
VHSENNSRILRKEFPRKLVRRLSKAVLAYARRYNGDNAINTLIMALNLWERAVETRKIDAVAMGFYGMIQFFDKAPEDCSLLVTQFEKGDEGEWHVALRPSAHADFMKARINLDEEELGPVQ